MEIYAVPLAALIVSLATLLLTSVSLRSKAGSAMVYTMREELTQLKAEVDACHRERAALQRKEIELTSQLLECQRIRLDLERARGQA